MIVFEWEGFSLESFQNYIFCRADKGSVLELIAVLKKLHANTGLMLNKDKSKAYFSKSYKYKSDLASTLGFSISTYLQSTWDCL